MQFDHEYLLALLDGRCVIHPPNSEIYETAESSFLLRIRT